MNKIVFMIDFAGTRTVLEDFKKRTSIKVCIIPSNRFGRQHRGRHVDLGSITMPSLQIKEG